MKLLLWLALLIPGWALSQNIKFRKYKKGQHFQYQLTTETFRNNQPDSRTISISDHRVKQESGVFFEQITWISKTIYSKSDTVHLDTIARKFPSYQLSLSPG